MAEHITCPKHGVRSTIQIRVFCNHWDPARKRGAMCLLRERDLPDALQAEVLRLKDSLQEGEKSTVPKGSSPVFSSYGLRLRLK